MAAKTLVHKKMSIENEIGKTEFVKEANLLTAIAENLPATSRIRIYKKSDEGAREFITAINAADFDAGNPHEFIKNKFYAKHGGGDYLLELIDNNDTVVHTNIISLIEEEGKESTSGATREYIEGVKEVVKMKEEVMDKKIEVQKEIQTAEKEKFAAALDTLNRQWEIMANMYKERIDGYEKQKNSSDMPQFMQMMLQNNIDTTKREMEQAHERFMAEMSKTKDKGEGTDKLFELMTTLLPTLLKGKEEKDPVETITRTLGLLDTLTGRNKDTIESLISSPEKMMMLKSLLNIRETEDKKDFFEDLMSNPLKVQMFKQMLNINDKPERKDFFEELIENPNKADIIKRVFGLEEKTDFFTDMIKNPEKFEGFKRMFNLMSSNEILEMENRNRANSPVVIPKDEFSSLVDTVEKLKGVKEVLVPLLGIQVTPPRSAFEFISQMFTALGPNLAGMVQNVATSLVTMSAINKGLITNIGQVPSGTFGQYSEIAKGEQQEQVEKVQPFTPGIEQRTVEINRQQPTNASSNGGKQTMVDIEKIFEGITIDVVSSVTQETTQEAFVDKLVKVMIRRIEEDPQIMVSIMAYKVRDPEGLNGKMATVFKKVMGIEDIQAVGLAQAVALASKKKYEEYMFGGNSTEGTIQQ